MSEYEVWRLAAQHMIQDLVDHGYCVGNPQCHRVIDCASCMRGYYIAIAKHELETAKSRSLTFQEALEQIGGRRG